MLWKDFLKEEDGSHMIEYVIFAGATIVLLGVGVGALMNAMSGYFGAWADFFRQGG